MNDAKLSVVFCEVRLTYTITKCRIKNKVIKTIPDRGSVVSVMMCLVDTDLAGLNIIGVSCKQEACCLLHRSQFAYRLAYTQNPCKMRLGTKTCVPCFIFYFISVCHSVILSSNLSWILHCRYSTLQQQFLKKYGFVRNTFI